MNNRDDSSCLNKDMISQWFLYVSSGYFYNKEGSEIAIC